MAPNRRTKHSNSSWAHLLVAAVPVLSGCQFRPEPLSAIAYNDDNDVVVQVTLRSADAKTIMDRELYFYLKVRSCNGTGNAFPADPPIEGGQIPGFIPPVQDNSVDITARVPAHIFAKYKEPCVFLEGGGYFTGTIESKMIPIVRKIPRGA